MVIVVNFLTLFIVTTVSARQVIYQHSDKYKPNQESEESFESRSRVECSGSCMTSGCGRFSRDEGGRCHLNTDKAACFEKAEKTSIVAHLVVEEGDNPRAVCFSSITSKTGGIFWPGRNENYYYQKPRNGPKMGYISVKKEGGNAYRMILVLEGKEDVTTSRVLFQGLKTVQNTQHNTFAYIEVDGGRKRKYLKRLGEGENCFNQQWEMVDDTIRAETLSYLPSKSCGLCGSFLIMGY